MEQILAWDPDVIFLSNFDSFTPASFTDGSQGEFWKQISAVKNEKIYKTPVGMYRWDTFCVETPLMVKWLGQVGNPDIFTEYNMEDDIRDFYATYMNYTLTEEDLARKRIAFYGKGGIGKTTLAANLAAELGRQGKRVLLIGCDPKADSCMSLTGRRIPTVLQQSAALDRPVCREDILFPGD